MFTSFLGTGAMGSALATTALDSGRTVTVWNRTADRTTELATRGATATDDVARAVDGDGVIVVCLFDHRSVHDVLDPVVSTLTGRTVINLTTTTPNQSRELATWADKHGITYLDGAIMAVPEMIGGAGSAILYSGSAAAFEEHRGLLELWGSAEFFGPDAGLASLHDMAMLTGMSTMIAGFLHGAAMVESAGVRASEFARRQIPFLTAMTDALAGYAETIDARDYAGPGQQSLRFTDTAMVSMLEATTDEGVSAEILAPVRELVRRQIDAGHGDHGTARMYESLRSTR